MSERRARADAADVVADGLAREVKLIRYLLGRASGCQQTEDLELPRCQANRASRLCVDGRFEVDETEYADRVPVILESKPSRSRRLAAARPYRRAT